MEIGIEVIAALVLKYGIPFTDWVIAKWNAKGTVTAAEWAEAKSLVQTPESILVTLAGQYSLTMDDPRIVALADLIKARGKV